MGQQQVLPKVDSLGFDSRYGHIMYVRPNAVLRIASRMSCWLVVARDSWGGVTLFRETGPSVQLQSVELEAGKPYEVAYLLTDNADRLIVEEI